jgi:hypothetical protein
VTCCQEKEQEQAERGVAATPPSGLHALAVPRAGGPLDRVACAVPSCRRNIPSASRRRSAISRSGSVKMLSGIALICGPRGDHLPDGSYRDRYRPPQVADRAISVASANDCIGWPVRSARPTNHRLGLRAPRGLWPEHAIRFHSATRYPITEV